ncbi:S-adenosyl-L-methionine-dependent methyltransferase [Podospora appendiculata]|uniref:S-adenosyl-L-methionine-dependent methyltransferase n=1 Tax=Podospora appendiculata TaxID=314037 RepID=A0AAE1CGT5_9PEZI|nr:S-adenosyl-L-methionine-dependent methyltransferase [Podospora appendiculata]
MASAVTDPWSTEHAASFVPKLATKIMQWLDPQKDDVILDVGCGDGILDVQISQILAHGQGRLHGIDSSGAMIEAARGKAAADAKARKVEERCTFEVLDATSLIHTPNLQTQQFTKIFSNAALHWILRPEAQREALFRGVQNALVPGGSFTFEMGGLGNVAEIRSALLLAIGRRVGLARAQEVDPWFFPDEGWVRRMLEQTVGGWAVERVEREWRPTAADEGGVEGWVRLMAHQFFLALPEGEREAAVKEVVDVLEIICARPGGGYMYNYVRLRVLARKL